MLFVMDWIIQQVRSLRQRQDTRSTIHEVANFVSRDGGPPVVFPDPAPLPATSRKRQRRERTPDRNVRQHHEQ